MFFFWLKRNKCSVSESGDLERKFEKEGICTSVMKPIRENSREVWSHGLQIKCCPNGRLVTGKEKSGAT